jgi:hypothetical protein
MTSGDCPYDAVALNISALLKFSLSLSVNMPYGVSMINPKALIIGTE